METSRLEKLLEFYREDPSDPFNLYALALEYQKNDTSKAKEKFNQILSEFPDYLPVYYTAAQFFISLEEYEKAGELFRVGKELAKHQNNSRTYQELVRAHQAFLDEQIDW
jgi:predicted Zn-dependent protease